MIFNKHLELDGLHSILSPSYYHWLNYNDAKMIERYNKYTAAQRGTELHALAHSAIKLGVKLSKADSTLSTYVNDSIKYKMTVEQPLYYSRNCFGHADSLSFRKNTLRIHDLKTGTSSGSMKQLEIYAAIFCLEYNINPKDIKILLRIYSNGGPIEHEPLGEDIEHIMNKIIYFDSKIEMLKEDYHD